MSKAFLNERTIKFMHDCHVVNSVGQSVGKIIKQFSIGIVKAYRGEYTPQQDDDLVEIKIIIGPDGKHLDHHDLVWIKYAEFKNLKVIYINLKDD